MSERIPVLYLAPWITYGGSDKNTIDWFRWIDRERFAPYLITTQPSPNQLVSEVAGHAEEIWVLPDLMPAERMPEFIFDFVVARDIRVIHLMNSRLGFDLLPDLTCLPSSPSVVVQLHVEEVDRSGYVRYVSTRYGNLVDRFSISNRHVAEAVRDYGVPEDRIEVIYTGVDAEEEFAPDRIEPLEGVAGEGLQVLFAARLADQKDPLLMADVAAELRDRGVEFQFHVVGEGELEEQLKARIGERELAGRVLLHPPTPGLQRWYATCDVLLLTSKFEGVPCVLFEAMGMGMPIVAPALPGIRELLDQEGDPLIAERGSVAAYADALEALARDRERLRVAGDDLRRRARQRFSVQRMASLHGEIYEQLYAEQGRPRREPPAPLPAPIRFRDRPREGAPLVSVVIPHYNQARFLVECVDSVLAQDYPELEVIVVDDASSESAAATALDGLEAREGVTVVRLEENGGPSRARNVGIERCRGRYVLPVDSDNQLLPGAIAALVAQLQAAGEEIGFVYPNIQYFGNREDYYEPPDFNLYTLLHGNYCDTCSLLDREIFDAGIRYREEIRLGHEDWEFFLRLAAHGIRGEAAEGMTLRYRKWGFNRSDVVDYARSDFRERFLAEVSPFTGREAQIKAEESPTLSLLALAPVEPGAGVAAALAGQSRIDMELVADAAGDWPAPAAGPPLRPYEGAGGPGALRAGLEAARGSVLAVTAGDGASLLADPAFCEKVLRRFAVAGDDLEAIVLADAGAEGRFGLRALAAGDRPEDLAPHTVIWRRTAELELPSGLHADPSAPIGSLVSLLNGGGAGVEWRHQPGPTSAAEPATAPSAWRQMPPDPRLEEGPDAPRTAARPLLPGEGEYEVPRWEQTPTWIGPLSTVLIRYREPSGGRRLHSTGVVPPGVELEHFVGVLRATGVQGTVKIVRRGEEFEAIPRERWLEELPADAVELGYAEEAPLPGFDGLSVAVLRETGQRILVTAPDDPILGRVDVVEHLGFVDSFPLRPREVPVGRRPVGLRGLLKAVDYGARRHRYAIGAAPGGELLAELGALAGSPLQGSVPVWVVDGYLVTDGHPPARGRGGYAETARWVAEPAAWTGLASSLTRVKAAGRRLGMAARSGAAPAERPAGEPDGWLYGHHRPGLTALYAAYHPVTGDQLLTRARADAAELGYRDATLLGFLRTEAPLSGMLDDRQLSIPWARRFGAVPRLG